MSEQSKVAISERALLQRVNRKLRGSGEQIRTARSPRVELDLGRYFVVNVRGSFLANHHIDLEALARDLEALKPWEALMR